MGQYPMITTSFPGRAWERKAYMRQSHSYTAYPGGAWARANGSMTRRLNEPILLTEQVGIGRANKLFAIAFGGNVLVSTDDDRRHGRAFFHYQARGRGQFVGHRDDGMVEFTALQIIGATQVEQGLEP